MSATPRSHAASLHAALVLALLLALVAEPASAQSNWLQTAAGTYSWQTAANWSTDPTVPGGSDAVANLTNDIAGDQLITLDAAVTLGTLGIGDASGMNGFTLAAGSGGPLTFDVTTGSAAITKTTGGADAISAPITLADALSVTVATGTLTLSGAMGNSVQSNVTKLGAGRLVMTGTNTYTGLTTIRAGTLDLTAGQISNTLNNGKSLNLASTAGDVATMNVSGGSIVFGTTAGLMIGERGTGTFNQTGGAVTVGGVILGDNTGSNSQGTANLTGGSFSSGGVTVAQRTIGAFNVGGTADVTIATLQFGSSFGGNSGSANLDGGMLRLNGVTRTAGTARFSFNGGTLVARQNNATFFTGTMTAEIKAGGANIDTAAFAVTIGPALVEAAGSPGGGLTKRGTGSLTLSGANTYTGTTTIAAGSLVIGTGGSLNGTTGTALSFAGSGRFAATPAAGVPQGMGVLSLTAGNGDVESTWAGTGTSTLAFSALAPRGATATGNFVTSGGTIGTDNRITLAGQAAGFIDQRLFAGGNAFAWYDAGGFVRGLAYDGVEGTTSAGGTSISGSHVQVTGPVTAQETGSFTTLAFTDASEFTLGAGQTVTVNGILKSGGSAGGTLSGGSGIRAATGQPLVIRTDLAPDTLTLGTPVLGGGTTSLIKAGAGTLTMNVAGTYGGPTVVNGGTLQLPTTATRYFPGGLEVAAGARVALGATDSVVGFTSLGGSGTVALVGGANGSLPDAFVATQLAASTFSGYLGTSGNGGSQFVKAGPATLTVTGTIENLGCIGSPAGFGPGRFRLVAGELVLAGAGGHMTGGSAANAASQNSRSFLSSGATLTLDNLAVNNNDRINNGSWKGSGCLTLAGATFNYIGNGAVDSTESYGNDSSGGSGTAFDPGQSVYSVTAQPGRRATVTSTRGFSRSAGGTVLFRGTALGADTAAKILAGATFAPALTGGAGVTSSTTATNIAILPWAVGDTSATGSGAGLVTYDATLGIRPLSTTNYAAYADSADATDNVRVAAATTLAASKTVNALVVDAGGGSLTLTGTGQTVTLTSGALALIGGNAVTLAGGTYAFGAAEGIVHAFADTSMSGSFTGSGGLTKAGFGTLAVSGTQTYTGVTRLSGGVLKLDVANGLPGGIGSSGGTSNLTLSGGVLGLTTASGDFTRGLGTGVTQVQFAGNGGFAAYGADRDVNLGGAGTPSTVTWNSGQFLVNTLLLGAPSADAKVRFRNPIALGANAPRMIEVADGSAPVDAELSGVVSGTGVSGIIKTGPGTLLLSAASTYTGDTTVYAGRLLVNGSLTATARAAVLPGATLGGSGSIAAAISGGGIVSPGNSPGILAATQFDGSGGLGAVFEFTGTTPDWAAATASVNDVLRLTDLTTPLAASLSAANEIDILFDIAGLPGAVPVAAGTYTGGFFTDVQSDFLSSLSLGDFRYWVRGTFGGTQQSFDGVVYSPLSAFDPSLSVNLATVPVTAGFAGGSISGQSMQLVVVPEPGGLLVAGVGIVVVGAGLARRRRRATACRP